MTTVVIIGASFAGLRAYTYLKKKADVKLILIDKEPVATYIPSLHLALGNTRYLNEIQLNTKKHYPEFICDTVTQVGTHTVVTKSGTSYGFDYLIDATGAPTNFFGNESFQKHALPAKTASQVALVNKKLRDAKKITIVGGGLSGVEYAGILATRYRKVINLVTATPRLVPGLPEKASRLTEQFFKRKKVNVFLNARATQATDESITFADGRTLQTDLILWCAGIKQESRIISSELAAQPHIFLAGDVRKSTQIPTAHNAMLCGEAVAKCIVGKLKGENIPLNLHNWETLALALGSSYGVLIIKNKFVMRNFLTGIMKWGIERRVMIEWKRKLLLPI